MKVVIILKHRAAHWTAPDWFLEKLRAEFSDVEFVYLRSYDNIEQDIRDADVIVTSSLRPEQVRLAPRLRWIHSTTAAVHQLLIPEIVNSDIILTNARAVHGLPVAEHVLALMFALAKRLPAAVRAQTRHEWGKEDLGGADSPQELRDATLVLIGVGSIGHEVARVAATLGMRVFAVRANPKKGVDWLPDGDPERAQHRVFGPKDLHRALKDGDFVVVSAPLTGATDKLIDREALSQIKPDAFLINVARGALVDEKALVEVLQQKRIAGAALDVFETEPLPENSPLWDLDNVLITPHQAGFARKLWQRQYKLLSDNLRRYRAGMPLLGTVDKKAGY
ncbi:MAG TPA: D-2-hydroxyacid dehydrogenase [Terriglobales bacterium]|nr:D-2-hydroxyacid dehydrogenase [Terriglobales bacterium]